MDIQTLQEKVTKAAEKVEKCKGTIERHEKQLQKKIAANAEQWEIKYKNEDIKGATKKLRDAETVLSNWKEKLAAEEEKERFITENAPQVIIDFLEDWKKMAYEYYTEHYTRFLEFSMKLDNKVYDAKLECVKAMPEHYARVLDENGNVHEYYSSLNVHPTRPMENFLKERKLDYRSVEDRKARYAGAIVMNMCTFRYEEERLAWLNKTLDQDKRAKLVDLITRIYKEVGRIIDAKYLRVSEKGNLDGYIDGENGRAKVQTVGAGGESHHVQVFHYRTLVHKMKD